MHYSLKPLGITALQITTWAHIIDLYKPKRQNVHPSVPLFAHEVEHILLIFSEARREMSF